MTQNLTYTQCGDYYFPDIRLAHTETQSLGAVSYTHLDVYKRQVPADLTIMTAMEYAGYTLKRGCGCRHGFCGACATIYRIKGKNELKTCLACQTQVQEGMYVASIPFFPTDKRTYDINDLKPGQQVMMELYPEIYSCIGCNACTKACLLYTSGRQSDPAAGWEASGAGRGPAGQ